MVNGQFCIGMSCNVKRRLWEHNNKQVLSTHKFSPWKLIYTEVVGERAVARLREKYLKSGIGRELLKKIIQDDPG